MERAIRVLLTVLPLGLAGCAAGQQATAKELADLRREVLKLRADQAAADERLDALEIARGKGLKGYAAPATAPSRSDRPELDVVKLGPDAGSDENDDPDAEGARPVLRSSGSGAIVEDPAAPPGKGKPNPPAKKEYAPEAAKKPGPPGPKKP